MATIDNWWIRSAPKLKTLFRVLFGVIWLIDGTLKFAPGFADSLPGQVQAQIRPGWLHDWFVFWFNQVSANPSLYATLVGTFEVLIGLGLVFGFMRKIVYVAGAILSLFIWAVPEGFGGTYGPGSTDIGTGAAYALVFVALIVINATYGTSRWSLDYWLERAWPRWAVMAEFGKPLVPREAS